MHGLDSPGLFLARSPSQPHARLVIKSHHHLGTMSPFLFWVRGSCLAVVQLPVRCSKYGRGVVDGGHRSSSGELLRGGFQIPKKVLSNGDAAN